MADEGIVEIAVGAFLALCTFILIIYLNLKRKYKYWENRGIQGPKPTFLLGNFKDLFLSKATEAEVINKACYEFENEKFIGLYYLWTPVLVVIDPKLVKNIVETDFDHFVDHPEIVGDTETDCVSNSLFMMKGKVWKDRRLYFSKLFTPKKTKEYFNDMDAGLDVLMKDIKECANGRKDVEALSFLEKYTILSIASTLYGLNLTSDDEATSKFGKIANMLIHPSLLGVVKIILHTVMPSVCNTLRISTQPREIWEYFSELVKNVLKSREANDSGRTDLVSLLMKLMNEGSGQIEKIDFKEAVGHFFAFFQAGHHTTEVTLSHILLRLSQYKDVQENVRKEIESTLSEKGAITYESIKEMVYLDNVISETLRIHPVLGVIKRLCTKPYYLDASLEIPKNTAVYIPVDYLQNHPANFKEPQVFNPDRFSTGTFETAAYMPFGKGPRLCLGMRLAELEMKKAICAIVSEYEILPSKKMNFPIVFDPKTLFFTNIPIGGIWIQFRSLC